MESSWQNAPEPDDETDYLASAGEPTDILVVISDSMDALCLEGRVDPASRIDVVESRLGVAVAADASHRHIDTQEAFTCTLLVARSVAYSASGASGLYFKGLIDRLGITDALNAKATIIPAGFTAETLLDGRADLAFQQMSELMVVPGISIVVRFPDAVQQVSTLSAAISAKCINRSAAEVFLSLLRSDQALAAYRACGLDPVPAAPP